MTPSREAHAQTVKVILVILVFVIACAVMGLFILWAVPRQAHAAWENVAGEWEQYRLNDSQMQWFKSLRSRNGNVPCCNIADGHPTEMKRSGDGGYMIPNPINPSVWMRVPDTAITTPRTNPIGVAVVWYVRNGEPEPQIRCFVPESES